MSMQSVVDHLDRFGAGHLVTTWPAGTATVETAAAALGVEPEAIAKSLAVRMKNTGEVIVLVRKGTARLDNGKFKAEFKSKPAFLPGDECEQVTGHPPGGVCPFGLPDGIRVFLDIGLRDLAFVYPAAGSPDSCLGLTPDQLAQWSGGEWVDVCR